MRGGEEEERAAHRRRLVDRDGVRHDGRHVVELASGDVAALRERDVVETPTRM